MFKRSGATRVAVAGSDDDALAVFAVGPGNVAVQDKTRIVVEFGPSEHSQTMYLCHPRPKNRIADAVKHFGSFRIAPVRSLLAPERVRDEPIATKLEVGSDAGGPFIVDTFQLPYDNPFNALFYVTGVDFLPNDLIAICTACTAMSGSRETNGELQWKRLRDRSLPATWTEGR